MNKKEGYYEHDPIEKEHQNQSGSLWNKLFIFLSDHDPCAS